MRECGRAHAMPPKRFPALVGSSPAPVGGPGGGSLAEAPPSPKRLKPGAAENDAPNVVFLAVLGDATSSCGIHPANDAYLKWASAVTYGRMNLWHCYVYDGPCRGFRYLEARPQCLPDAPPAHGDGGDRAPTPASGTVNIYRAEVDMFEDYGNSDSDDEDTGSEGIIYTATKYTVVKVGCVMNFRPPHRRGVRMLP